MKGSQKEDGILQLMCKSFREEQGGGNRSAGVGSAASQKVPELEAATA